LSSRMSGADGLNPQAIKREEWVRRCFTLAEPPYTLCGGDFDAFEVTLAEAAWHDENLRQDLINGVKIHAVMASMLYPTYTYEQIVDGYKSSEEECQLKYGVSKDLFTKMYTDGKQAIFAIAY